MALTKTARLELINPYAKYGLKRRPTFGEIVGLVSENDKLISPFPNREATRFRNSPQGSFFDGSDNLDLLKEQQTRILDRQMRETMLRRQTQQNGGTFHLMKHQEQQTSGVSTPISSSSGFETPSEVNEAMFRVSFEEEMRSRLEDERERIYRRQQEVKRRHEEGMNKLNQTLMHRMMRWGLTGLQEYEEELPPLEDVAQEASEEELIPAEQGGGGSASSTRQQEPPSLPAPPARYRTETDYNNNIDFCRTRSNITERDIKFQFFVRGIKVPEINEVSKEELKRKGKGKARTYKEYLLDMIADAIEDGSWTTPIPDDFVEQQKEVWAMMIGKGKTRNLSQSLAGGAKEGAKEVARQVVKAAVAKAGELAIKKVIGV